MADFFDVGEMIESPNSMFWSMVFLIGALFGAQEIWPGTFTELEEIARPVPLAWPLMLGGWMLVGLAAILALGLGLAIVQPRQIGHRLTVFLVGWRLLRFVFVAAAAAMLLWFVFIVIAVGVGLTRAAGSDSNRLTQLKMGLLVLALLGIVFTKLLPPLIGDLGRLGGASWLALRTDLWARRRLRGASPPMVPAGTATPQVLILSDLHITAPDAKTLEGDLDDHAARAFIADTIAQLKPQALIAAGDLTDTGQEEAWQEVTRLATAWGRPLYGVPGNHDVNFRVFGERPHRLGSLRAAIDLDPDTVRPGSYTADQLDRRMQALMRATGVADPPAAYPALFHHAPLRLSVLALDSNRRPSSSPITNALGLVGPEQLRDAAALLAHRPADHTLVVVLHHHIFPAGRRHFDDLFLICVDASEVLRLAFDHRAAAIIHGHKHMPYVRTLRDRNHTMRLISAGSALYPAKGPCAGVVHTPSLFGLVLDGGELIDVTLHRPADQA